jgi:hypothetical protein
VERRVGGEFGVGVLMVGEGLGDDLVGEHVALSDHAAHLEILDRVLVGPEAELAAHRIELGGPERRAERVLVRDVAADVLDAPPISRAAS